MADTTTFFNWPAISWSPPIISNNGKYVAYSIENVPIGSSTMILQRLDSKWKIALPGIREAIFTDDNRQIVYMLSSDSLCLLTLATAERSYIPKVKSFKLFMRGDTEWLAFQLDNKNKELILQNLKTGKQDTYVDVDSYLLSDDGKTMLLQTFADTVIGKPVTLKWVTLSTNKKREIWRGQNVNSICMDNIGTQVAFLTQKEDTEGQTIWSFKEGEDKAVELKMRIPADVQDMKIEAINNFSRDGGSLFVQLRPNPRQKPTQDIVPVNIWSYMDAKLQSQQLHELKLAMPSYLAVISLASPSRIARLQQDNETIAETSRPNLLLLTNRKGERTENYWNKEALGRTDLLTINDAKRVSLPLAKAAISPGGKYIVGCDLTETECDFFAYEISTGITRNITANIPIPVHNEEGDTQLAIKTRGLALAAWLTEDRGILIYDNYDIWLVDPSGKKSPINLTQGYRSKLQFRLASEDILLGRAIQPSVPLLLQAFDKKTKKSGFYQLELSAPAKPVLLYMGDYLFKKFLTLTAQSFYIKARDANVYLVSRERVDESPNIFYTTNFKSFSPVSNVYPEKEINWISSELVSFTTVDGIQTQGVLYKPEDFDSTKMYPVIIHYYDKKSDELNKYQQPVVENGGDIDIAWFSSHGYLILLTDIHYKLSETGESAYKAIMAAAEYISRRSYVDKTHMAIQGHSFGGYETNYLITHTGLFAAAVSSSGVSNLISDYGTLWPSNVSKQEYWEMRSGRLGIGITPWENPEIYVKNSPIFYVDRVETPILMVNNKNDKNVAFEQGLEFFTALRRTGKRVWMLQYDNGGHGVRGKEYRDYLFRMSQFFDHYLKGAPAPKWMTRGIPATMRNIDDGLEYDHEIKTPDGGLLIN